MKFNKTGATIGSISGIVGALLGSWITNTMGLHPAFTVFLVIVIAVSIVLAILILRKTVGTAETEQKPKPAD